MNANKPEVQEITVSEQETLESYEVNVELIGAEDSDVIVDADMTIIVEAEAEVLDETDMAIEEEIELKLNETTYVGTLDKGNYTVHLLSAPIELDGSTYVLPKDAIEFSLPEVDGDTSGFVTITIELEKLAVEDMTKEQLEAVATIIDTKAPEHADVAATLREKAVDAVSDPESAADVAQDSTSNGTVDNGTAGSTGGSTTGNTGGNTGTAGGGSSTPPATTHSHSWVDVTESRWFETSPAVPGKDAQYGVKYYWKVLGVTYYDEIEAARIAAANKTNVGGPYEERYETSPAIPGQDAKGEYRTVVVGKQCSSCGARQ